MDGAEVDAAEMEAAKIEGVTQMGGDALSALDLVNLEALANVSEDQREPLARAATVLLCASGVFIPPFALALILEGGVTVTNADGSRVIAQLGQGVLVHPHGTLDTVLPLLVAVTTDDTTLALWSDAALAEALATSPWVEEDLRTEGDRLQAWAQVAESPLAARLPDEVRLRLFTKLRARTLAGGEHLMAEGDSVPGLILVGAGSVVTDGKRGREMTSGEFVFPEAALSAARADAAAHAGTAGAVVLVGDRQVTQELVSTEPLLLEILAGM